MAPRRNNASLRIWKINRLGIAHPGRRVTTVGRMGVIRVRTVTSMRDGTKTYVNKEQLECQIAK